MSMSETAPPDVAPTAPRGASDKVKSFIGDLARPFAIYATSGAASAAVVILAQKVASPEAAIFIGAVFVGLGSLYGAKAWENAQGGKHAAQIEVAKATGSNP